MSEKDSSDQREAEPTSREIEVLRAVLEYDTIEGAAKALYISRNTVATHLYRLRKKSGKHHLHQIVHWADEHNWWQKVCPTQQNHQI